MSITITWNERLIFTAAMVSAAEVVNAFVAKSRSIFSENAEVVHAEVSTSVARGFDLLLVGVIHKPGCGKGEVVRSQLD